MEMTSVLIYHDEKVVQTTVTLPDYLRAYAREQGISLSGTLREALRKDYVEKTGKTATNQPRSTPKTPTTTGGTA